MSATLKRKTQKSGLEWRACNHPEIGELISAIFIHIWSWPLPDFHFQIGEMASFVPPYVSIQKPYVCTERAHALRKVGVAPRVHL